MIRKLTYKPSAHLTMFGSLFPAMRRQFASQQSTSEVKPSMAHFARNGQCYTNCVNHACSLSIHTCSILMTPVPEHIWPGYRIWRSGHAGLADHRSAGQTAWLACSRLAGRDWLAAPHAAWPSGWLAGKSRLDGQGIARTGGQATAI